MSSPAAFRMADRDSVAVFSIGFLTFANRNDKSQNNGQQCHHGNAHFHFQLHLF